MNSENKIEAKLENILIFISLIKKLFKILVFHKKNNVSFNKLLLLANKEYYASSHLRRTFNSFEKVSSKDIHKKISRNYKAYKNSKTFNTKIKYIKTLQYWIEQLDRTKIIRNYNVFIENLQDDLDKVIELRVSKQYDKDGQIEEDLNSLEDIFDLKEVYLKKLEAYNKILEVKGK